MIEQLVRDEQRVFNDSQTLNHFVRIFIIVFRQLLHDTLSLTSQSKSVMVNNELMMFLNRLHKQTKMNSLYTVEDFVLISELLSQQKYDSLLDTLQFRQDSETLSFTLSLILIGQRLQKEPIWRLVIGRELVKSSKFSTPTTP